MPIDKNDYPENWKEISLAIRERYGHRCQRCHTVSKPKHVLTVHHLDMDPNLVLLCQKCHLHIQAKGKMDMNRFYDILNAEENFDKRQGKLL